MAETSHRPVYYYLRDKEKQPLVTVCLLVDMKTREVVSRGVAICSPLDHPTKRIGRGIAYGRALRAGRAWPDDSEGVCRPVALRQMERCASPEIFETHYAKAMRCPVLSVLEADIIGRMFRAEVTEEAQG
ncbi:MAG TPA: hypothetical protein PLD71_10630 [Syntrophales bacterium]|nr:hypothetical protein [Syntrophales bacterium]HQP29671.1 hypothetical protein [Syntrophales bacterium]